MTAAAGQRTFSIFSVFLELLLGSSASKVAFAADMMTMIPGP